MTARLFQTLAGLLGVALLGVALPTLSAASAPGPEADAPAVRVRRIKQVVDVPAGGAPGSEDDRRTVDAVVLENAYLSATVVPVLGGRVTRLVHRPTGRDLLAAGETGGGCGFRFPFPDAARRPEEAGPAWRIVRDADGTVTVAVDRRFRRDDGDGPSVVLPLRLGVLVTLRPDSPVLEVTGRVDNRLPIRVGFRLGCGARFPASAGTRVLLPAPAVADAALATVRPWPGAEAVPLDRLAGAGGPVWAVQAAGDWVGVYDPSADVNHLLIRPRYAAPGAMVTAAGWAAEEGRSLPSRRRETAGRSGAPTERLILVPPNAIEAAVGSCATGAHPGHYLQPFGAYVMRARLALVRGIGPVAWADRRLAVGLERTDAGTTVRVVGLGPPERVRLVVRAGPERREIDGRLRPDRPLRLRPFSGDPFAARVRMDGSHGPAGSHARVRLTVLDADRRLLADVTVPPAAGPFPATLLPHGSVWTGPAEPADETALAGLRAEMEPWDGLAMELAGWYPPAGAGGLGEAVRDLTRPADAGRTDRLLAAARVLMRASRPGSGPWQAVRGRLAFRADRGNHQAAAHAYVALMLALEADGRVTPAALQHGVRGAPVPAGHYVTALGALARGDMMGGLRHLRRCTEQAPPIAMGLGERALPGGDRLHPAAVVGGQWPTLLRAVVRLEIRQPRRARAVLERLLREDPSRPEAVALLADACDRLAEGPGPETIAHRRRALARREAAEGMLEASPALGGALDGLYKEARLGRWTVMHSP